MFEFLDDEYFKECVIDICDIGICFVKNVLGMYIVLLSEID